MPQNNNLDTLSFISLGCAKNLVDSEQIMGDLVNYGYQLTSRPEDSSVVVINTCAFLGEARQEALDTINEIAEIKRKEGNKLKRIVVVGCLTQYFDAEMLKEKVPEIDLIIPLENYHKIPELLRNDSKGNAPDHPSGEAGSSRLLSSSPHSVYVKIAEGCDNRCAYCLIPSLRGRLRSKQMDDIISEVRALRKLGAREINLIAQDTTSYGRDIYGKPMIVPLLNKLIKLKGITWIRLLYTHPAHISSELIKVVSSEPKICNYIDMPIQHISNKSLNLMGRQITREEIITVYNNIRENIPGAALRTTVMVGYPGEGKEEFYELFNFLRQYPFERVGAFVFSLEKGTRAFNQGPRVRKEVAEARLEKVMMQQKKISRELNRSMLGKVSEVMVDEIPRQGRAAYGRLFSQAPEVDGKVFINRSLGLKPGDLVKVKMMGAGTYDLLGEKVSNEFSQ